jgi:HEAT repeat protein
MKWLRKPKRWRRTLALTMVALGLWWTYPRVVVRCLLWESSQSPHLDLDFRCHLSHETIRSTFQWLGPRAVPPLMSDAANPRSTTRLWAVRELGDLRTRDAVPLLIDLLRPPRGAATIEDDLIRESAADALGSVGDARAVVPLIAALDHGSDRVRAASAQSLGRLGDTSAVPELVRALGASRGTRTPSQCAAALGRLGDNSAIPALTAALGNRWAEIDAAVALTRLGSREGIPCLVQLIRTPSHEDRSEIFDLIVALGDDRGIAALRDVMTNDDAGWVRDAARKALEKLPQHEH